MQTVMVDMAFRSNPKGKSVAHSARSGLYRVTHRYMDGRVRVHTGDVWHVLPAQDGKSTYVVDKVKEGGVEE